MSFGLDFGSKLTQLLLLVTDFPALGPGFETTVVHVGFVLVKLQWETLLSKRIVLPLSIITTPLFHGYIHLSTTDSMYYSRGPHNSFTKQKRQNRNYTRHYN